MGLFSGLKKLGKSIFKGIKKVFKKVAKIAGKVLNSKWGKALMLASAVFSGGIALASGMSGFAGTTGSFMTKFVAGGKEFMAALANPMARAKTMLGGASAAAGQAGQVAQAAQTASGAQQATAAGEMIGAAGTAAKTGADAAGALATGAQAATSAGQGVAGAANAASGGVGGLLKKAAGAAWKYASSPQGSTLISNTLKGYAAGQQQEELLKEEERVRRYYDNQWRDPAKLAQLNEVAGRDVNVPGGYLDRARRVSEFLNKRQYEAPAQAGDPNQVASYAVSPGG